MFTPQTLALFTVFLPLTGAILAGLGNKRAGAIFAHIVTCLGMLGAFASAVTLALHVIGDHAPLVYTLGTWLDSGTFHADWALKVDSLTAVMLVVVTTVSTCVHVYSVGYMHDDPDQPRFMAYLSLFTFFMLMLVTASNLLQLFFGWEGVGVASYLLINFWFKKPSANNASIKAFLVNRVGDFGFALGIMTIFALFGSIEFTTILDQNQIAAVAGGKYTFLGTQYDALTLACVLLFVGAMGKSAQLGLHTWLPDAMEGPTPVSALIHAATMVTAGVFMVCRLSPLFEHAPNALLFVTFLGALTTLVAATIGFTQFDIKRVIAYSTMSQLGYMFFAAGVSAYGAAMFHLTTHAFFKALLFLGAGSVIHGLHGEQDLRKMGNGIWRDMPYTYFCMWVGSLALAGIGIPGIFGFAGFYSKDMILEAAYGAHGTMGYLAYWCGVAAAFLTAFYSWRLILMAFHARHEKPANAALLKHGHGHDHHDEEGHAHHAHESGWLMLVPLIPLVLGAIFSGYYGYEYFVGHHYAEFWGDALFVARAPNPLEAAEEVDEWVEILPLVVAFSGIFFAYVCYSWFPSLPSRFVAMGTGLYRLFFNKYYIDELYTFLFVKPASAIGRFFWKKGDDGLIDGVGPNGLSALASRLGVEAARLQTGYIFHYVLGFVLGLAILITWFSFR